MLNVSVQLLNAGFKLLNAVNSLFLAFPKRLFCGKAFFKVGKLLAQLFKPFTAELVLFLFKRHFFNFKLHDFAAYDVELLGH